MLAFGAFLSVVQGNWVVGLWLFLAALASDFLDGFLAKKLNAVTKLGEEMDGLADSVVVVLGLFSLAITGHMSWWFLLSVLMVGAALV